MKYYIYILIVMISTACVSIEKRVAEAQPYSSQINWPPKYTPEDSTFYVHNKILINASPEKIWNVLIDAESWPDWYEGASNVKIIKQDNGLLKQDSVFTWKTMGFDFTSEVTEFDKPYRLSWESDRSLISGYHAWLLVPEGSQTWLITDESQHGVLAVLQSIFQRKKLHGLHQTWLEKIREKSEMHAENDTYNQ